LGNNQIFRVDQVISAARLDALQHFIQARKTLLSSRRAFFRQSSLLKPLAAYRHGWDPAITFIAELAFELTYHAEDIGNIFRRIERHRRPIDAQSSR
jgi:hypothetical protein